MSEGLKLDLGGVALRPLCVDDAPALFATVDANRSHLRAWLPWLDTNRTVADSEAFIRSTLERAQLGTGLVWGLWEGPACRGVVDWHAVNRSARSGCIGYWLAREAEGRGLMTRTVAGLMDWALAAWDLHRAEIRVATGNSKSQAIPRRLGFVHEGTVREVEWLYDHFVDHMIFGMLARDWRAMRDRGQSSSG